MKIQPIRNETDYRVALAEIERLWDAAPGAPAGDRLEVLATLVEAYEEKSDPIDPPDPIEAIRYRMESRGLNRKDLDAILGDRQRVEEILGCKRRLTISMIRKLNEALGISADILIRPYALAQKRNAMSPAR
jgi:HTH-type transcriptional regulator/antitoxin HigA